MVVDLYEDEKIDAVTLRILTSLVIVNAVKDTVSGLKKDLMRSDFSTAQHQGQGPNKILLLNYSKKNYA